MAILQTQRTVTFTPYLQHFCYAVWSEFCSIAMLRHYPCPVMSVKYDVYYVRPVTCSVLQKKFNKRKNNVCHFQSLFHNILEFLSLFHTILKFLSRSHAILKFLSWLRPVWDILPVCLRRSRGSGLPFFVSRLLLLQP